MLFLDDGNRSVHGSRFALREQDTQQRTARRRLYLLVGLRRLDLDQDFPLFHLVADGLEPSLRGSFLDAHPRLRKIHFDGHWNVSVAGGQSSDFTAAMTCSLPG